MLPFCRFLLAVAYLLLLAGVGSAEQSLVLQGNMDVIKCQLPDANYRLLGGSAPGQLYLPDEPVNLRFAFKKGADAGKVDFTLEIQEITTRDPDEKVKGASATRPATLRRSASKASRPGIRCP